MNTAYNTAMPQSHLWLVLQSSAPPAKVTLNLISNTICFAFSELYKNGSITVSFVTSFFLSGLHLWQSSIPLHVVGSLFSFSYTSFLLYEYTRVLVILLIMDIWAISGIWLLWMVFCDTLTHVFGWTPVHLSIMYICRRGVSRAEYTDVQFKDILPKGCSTLCSPSSAWKLQMFHILANSWYCHSF